MRPSFRLLAAILFLGACKTTSANQDSDVKFNSAEHKMLGDEGFKAASKARNFEYIADIPRMDKTQTLTYGELVAFSGDFYGSYSEIYEMGHSWKGFPPMDSTVQVEKLKAVVASEEEAVKDMQADPKVEYPDNNLEFGKIFKLSYLELSTNNLDHFGWHNMKAYVKYHAEAIKLALAARNARTPEEKKAGLHRALYANGFADHFLTDGFSSGHIRIPRKESLALKSKFFWVAADQRMGSLAKILHDNDPCVYQSVGTNPCRAEAKDHLHHGTIKVENAKGDKWATRGDGDLYRGSDQSAIYVAIPIKAVAASTGEILDAFLTGKEPSGVYAATEFVPFVSPEQASIESGFSQIKRSEEFDRLKASAGAIATVVSSDSVKQYLEHLPELMKAFRDNVRADIADPSLGLQRRLPKAYLNAYQNVR